MWAQIEMPVFIIAGCLLTLGPLFREIRPPASVVEYLTSVRSRLSGRMGNRYAARMDQSDLRTESNQELHPVNGATISAAHGEWIALEGGASKYPSDNENLSQKNKAMIYESQGQ
jgi:hypothetical protein